MSQPGHSPPQTSARRAGGLPIVDGEPTIKRSKMGRRRAAVLIGIHVLIAAHIAHWWLTGSTLTPVEPSEAMELSKHSVVNAGLIFFAATILLTAIFGRFFCGWACHLVALQDLCRWLLLKVGIHPRPFRSRLLRLVPGAAFLYMFIWPLVYRLRVGDSLVPLRAEMTTSTFWETFPGWGLALATFAVCGFLIVYFLGAKGFCTYACPYGAIFGVADRVAPVSIRVTDACRGCAHCTAVCSSNVRVHEEVHTWGMVVDPGCMKCMDCVSVCPNDALYVGTGRPSLAATERSGRRRPSRRPDLTWKEESLLALSFLAAFLVFRGLYGSFPFLFSLGLAAILGYLTLQLSHLLTRPHLRLGVFTLKRRHRVLPAGWAFAGCMALVAGLWTHSALVRYHQLRADRSYAASTDLVAATIERGAPPTLGADERRRVDEAFAHLAFLDRWALRGSPELDIRLAWIHRLAGRPAAFRARAERALAAAPGNATMRVELGNYFFHRGELERAAELYVDALALEQRFAEAAVNLGTIYARQGRFAEAGAVFERALEATPDSPQLNYNLAMIRIAFDRPEPAIASFERALEIDPDFVEARENLAGYLCSLERFEEGIAHYRRALELAPDDPSTHLLLARALAATGELDDAERQTRRAIAIAPGHPGGAALLAEIDRLRAERGLESGHRTSREGS